MKKELLRKEVCVKDKLSNYISPIGNGLVRRFKIYSNENVIYLASLSNIEKNCICYNIDSCWDFSCASYAHRISQTHNANLIYYNYTTKEYFRYINNLKYYSISHKNKIRYMFNYICKLKQL